jgi:hypothetical protein
MKSRRKEKSSRPGKNASGKRPKLSDKRVMALR